ncbi:MAG: ATP-binding protein [Lachnospiraceae bacterium]|nr:ATP-binding protein [Lachnospiraceae bacterium]
MQLLLYQQRYMEKLIDEIHDGEQHILIEGKSGSGKSFTIKQLQRELNKEKYQTIIFDGDYQYDDREYHPFKKALFSDSDSSKEIIIGGVAEVSKEIPIAGNIISYVIKSFATKKNNTNNPILNSEEQNILSKLRQILKKPNIVLVFDNIHWWDRRSLQLLKLLLTNKQILNPEKLNKFTIIFSITSNQSVIHGDLVDSIMKETEYKKIPFPVIDLLEFKDTLFCKTLQSFSSAQIDLLYNLVNGHLQVFFEIINEITNHNFDFNATYESNKQYLCSVLEKRLEDFGADSTQILKTLEYASIIGLTFSVYELKNITQSSENELRSIINKTSKLAIIEETNNIDYIKFAHDIIREIFKNKVDEQHIEYYSSLAMCIKEIKPDQYLKRARYFIKCHQTEDAITLYILELIKQIRLFGKALPSVYDEINPLFNSFQREYIHLMQEAYNLYSQKKYKTASSKLDLILDVYPIELLAERDILQIRCYSKTMASTEIQKIVKKYNEIRGNSTYNNEKDIWERFSQVLMIAFAHLGEIETAKEIENDILRSLSGRINYDDTAAKRMYIIKRVANSIHNIEISSVFVKDAFKYFGGSVSGIRDVKQYYISLVNLSTILINEGEFDKAYNITMKGFNIEDNNQDVDFPRIQLLRNNYIISGYLSGNLNEDECILLYKEILSAMPNIISERLFYKSNLSIFWALKDEPKKAYDIIQEEAKLHYDIEEKEGLYQYRVVTNSSIYLYMLGYIDIAIEQLKNIYSLTRRLINGSYFSKKNEILIQLMEQNITTTGKEWLNKPFSLQPTYQDIAWKYFGLGYAFMAVCNWDMSE